MQLHHYEEVKAKILEEAKMFDIMNAKANVRGKRIKLPLEGRDIEVVYYEAARKNAPIMFAMHGGGYLFGGCALDDNMWHTLREEWNINVVSIGYRKSPDYPYPYALYDVYDTIKYFLNKQDQFNFNKDYIWVYGCSAGANLAACVSIYAKLKKENFIKKQILIYPFLDNFTDPAEKKPAEDEIILYKIFNELHIKPKQAREICASPVYASVDELRGLPEAIIILAENDCLRAEGEKYIKLLRAADVEVTDFLAKNMPHGYVEFAFSGIEGGFCPEAIRLAWENGTLMEAKDKTMKFIKEHLFFTE